MHYYNENNREAAAWLRELMQAGEIPAGVIDERSIRDVQPNELSGYVQCHFFAGIGGWPLALRLAGWPEDRPVWTASCPCQPFSGAGEMLGTKDPRHLWPVLRKLIGRGQPAIVFGEQVASELGRVWLSGVRANLARLGYALGAADLCAAGVSSPQIRQRLYWVAHPNRSQWRPPAQDGHVSDWQNSGRQETPGRYSVRGTGASRLVNANGYHQNWWSGPLQVGWNCCEGEIERGGRKYRAQWRVKPGVSILADGVPGRVAQLCGFGNAIVPLLAAEFIQASAEAIAQ